MSIGIDVIGHPPVGTNRLLVVEFGDRLTPVREEGAREVEVLHRPQLQSQEPAVAEAELVDKDTLH